MEEELPGLKMEKYLKRKTKIKYWHKYNPEFIKFSFVNGGNDKGLRAQCMESGLMLSTDALKPSKLRRHLETKHPMLIGNPVDFFKRKQATTTEKVCCDTNF